MNLRWALAGLAAFVVALPGAAAAHTIASGTTVLDCVATVSVGGIVVSNGCIHIQTVASAEPDGGTYRLTVTWTVPAGAPEWTNLRADLRSCEGGCSGVNVLVQQAANAGPSPLVVEIPTTGPESHVNFIIRPFQSSVSVFTPSQPLTVAFALTHIG